jgi:DNA helicase IV
MRSAAIPKYDILFVDEAQDLLESEVELIEAVSNNLFLVGDDRQRIFEDAAGLEVLERKVSSLKVCNLPFHYRIVREICEMADRILTPTGGNALAATAHYEGPAPGRISVEGPHSPDQQITLACERLRDQVRVYADLIAQGDRLGVVVPRKADRDDVFAALEADPSLRGKSQIVRARDGSEGDRHTTAIDVDRPILILTTQGVKGLEFRALQWLFADKDEKYATPERVYTVVTRAKTSLDIYYTARMPQQIAKSYSPPSDGGIW